VQISGNFDEDKDFTFTFPNGKVETYQLKNKWGLEPGTSNGTGYYLDLDMNEYEGTFTDGVFTGNVTN
jgi:hypothetical protein